MIILLFQFSYSFCGNRHLGVTRRQIQDGSVVLCLWSIYVAGVYRTSEMNLIELICNRIKQSSSKRDEYRFGNRQSLHFWVTLTRCKRLGLAQCWHSLLSHTYQLG